MPKLLNHWQARCPEQLYVITSSYLAHESEPVWLPCADGTEDFRRCTPAGLLESIVDQTTGNKGNVSVSLRASWRIQTLCAEGQKIILDCIGELSTDSGEEWENAREIYAGHFPSKQGAKATDSAVLDSNDNNGSSGCTRSLLLQGHSSSSASQREFSQVSTTLIKCWHVVFVVLWYVFFIKSKMHEFCLMETSFIFSTHISNH